MLHNEPQNRQHQIVSRIWTVIGITVEGLPDEAIDEMLADWCEALTIGRDLPRLQ